MKYLQDTIAAIATSSTAGGISVIRISGSEALKIVEKIYRSKSGNKILSEQKSHTVHYGYIYDGDTILDEVIILLMLSPNSYTKEDVLEIDCHGGRYVTKNILELLIKSGAKIAEPGEFTKRAFLNGRIDLSQAEAVTDIINAKNKYALQSSIMGLRGNIKSGIYSIRKELLLNISFIEAVLDDPEHMSWDNFSDEFNEKVNDYISRLYRIMENYENGRVLREGIQTVITGKPNVGKSSLMNVLLCQERAIVTNIPGTTRDILEEEIQIGDFTLCIKDTAGIHDTEDEVEKIGILKAKQSLKDADFVIVILDRAEPLDENDKVILEMTKEVRGVILLNKSDLESVISEEDMEGFTDKRIINFSTKDKSGLADLEEYLKELFYQDELLLNDEIYISNVRQKEALVDAIESMEKAKEGLSMNMSEDLITIDLIDCFESLGKIVGETLEDDIIDTIFREFCMGK